MKWLLISRVQQLLLFNIFCVRKSLLISGGQQFLVLLNSALLTDCIGVVMLPLGSTHSIIFKLLNILRLLILAHLGVDVLHGGLDVGDAGGGHRDAPGGEDLQGRFRKLQLVSNSRMKFRLVARLLESLGKRNYFDAEGEVAGAEHVYDPPVLDPDLLVLGI